MALEIGIDFDTKLEGFGCLLSSVLFRPDGSLTPRVSERPTPTLACPVGSTRDTARRFLSDFKGWTGLSSNVTFIADLSLFEWPRRLIGFSLEMFVLLQMPCGLSLCFQAVDECGSLLVFHLFGLPLQRPVCGWKCPCKTRTILVLFEECLWCVLCERDVKAGA